MTVPYLDKVMLIVMVGRTGGVVVTGAADFAFCGSGC